MTEQELSTELFDNAAARALAAGRRLGEGADLDLKAMTQAAAQTLLAIPDYEERHREIAAAHANLARLIEMAIAVAGALTDRGLYPGDLLGEQSYFPAKIRFCPCKPFC
jgi:hypothetical protein